MRRFLLPLVLISLFMITSPAYAGGIVVNTNADGAPAKDGHCTLREAILNANADNQSGSTDCAAGIGADTITFADNYTITLAGSELPIVTSDLTILGNGLGSTIIQASASPHTVKYRILQVDTGAVVTLQNLTVRNGGCYFADCGNSSLPDQGGAIYNSGNLTVRGVRVSDSFAQSSGGGIYSTGALAILTGSVITNNSTFPSTGKMDRGGGIYASGPLTIDASVVSTNSSQHYGGGIAAIGSVTIQNGSVIGGSGAGNNIQTETGGGLYVEGGPVMIDASTVSANMGDSTMSGAGIYAASGTVTIRNHSVIGGAGAGNIGIGVVSYGTLIIDASEVSANNGHGVANHGGSLSVLNGSLIGGQGKGNIGGENGGGIYTTGIALIENSVISYNETGTGGVYSIGGGIYNEGQLTVRGSTLANNIATDDQGGGIYTTGDTTLDTVTIIGNSASQGGGGIDVEAPATLTMTHTIVGQPGAGNMSELSGGGVQNLGTIIIDSSTISANSARPNGSGGGIANRGTVTIRNGSLIGGAGAGNIAENQGGGGISNSGKMTIDASTVSANQSIGSEPFAYGGGIATSGPLTVQNGSVIGGAGTGNTTSTQGGGIYISGGQTIIDASIVSANSATNSGGIVNNGGNLIIRNGSIIGGMSAGNVAPFGGGLYNGWATYSVTSITGSCLTGNSVIGAVNGISALQTATGNWWGDPGGPGVGGADTTSGNWVTSGWLTAGPLSCKGGPFNLNASPVGLTTINLFWADAATDETQFQIERSDNGTSGWVQIATPLADATTFSDASLSCGITRYYHVRAHNASADSAWTPAVSAATAACLVPNAPSGLAASSGGVDTIKLNWTDGSSDETNFRVERSDDGAGGWAEIGTAAADTPSYSDATLACNTTRYYRVRAYRSGDGQYSTYSNVNHATTDACPPPNTPVGLTAAASGMATINLIWTDASSDETNFRVERSDDGAGGWTEIGTAAANTPNYSDGTLTCNTTRYYRVRAYRAGDGKYSDYSNVDHSTTDACPPGTPSGLAASSGGVDTINLNWTDGSSDETNFRVERSDDGLGGWSQIGTAAANTPNYSDATLTCNTTRYYRVRAYRGSDGQYSTYSNINHATTDACPLPSVDESPHELKFGSLIAGQISPAQSVTLTNSGDGILHVEQMTISANFALSADLCSNQDVKPNGGTCTFAVTFQPATAGGKSGSVTIPTNAGTVSVSLTGVGLNKLAAPTLISPKNGALAYTRAVKLTWKAVTGAKGYRVEVGTDSGFVNPLAQSGNPTGASFTTKVLAFGVYFWHVATKDALGQGVYSAPWRFEVTLNKTPAKNATVATGLVKFAWQAVAGKSYTLQYGSDPHFLSSDTKKVSTGRTATYTIPKSKALAGGHKTYYWRVSIDGGKSWTPYWTFIVK